MSNGKPYVKWFARDWLGDPLVRMLKPEERGVWIDLLNWMMTTDPYGHLVVNGEPMPDEDAARLVGMDSERYKGCLKRIEGIGVSSRTPEGILYSRRLVRDHQEFIRYSKAGKMGGNPSLRKEDPQPPEEQKKPESRSQNPEATESLRDGLRGGISHSESVKRAEFESIWKAFPSKSGSKEKAFEAWKKWKKEGDTVEIAIEGIKRYMAFIMKERRTRPEYPYQNATTFFNQRGWTSDWKVDFISEQAEQDERDRKTGKLT